MTRTIELDAVHGAREEGGRPHARLVFEPSGLEIDCFGLEGTPLAEVVSRWCCTVGDGRRAEPGVEITVRSNGDRHTDLEPCDASLVSESGILEERFGHWRSLIRPGSGRDDVAAAISAAPTSGDFSRAIDLCVAHLLALQGGAMLHGAAFEIGGTGVLSIGFSGAGKSTIAAAAVTTGGTVVSDDLLLAAKQPSGEIGLATMRRDMVLREAGFQLLFEDHQDALRPFNIKGKRRWLLSPETVPSAFTGWIRPRRLWLVSVDRRLGSSRIGRVDQAAALAWLIRGTTDRFLADVFPRERNAQIEVLRTLAEHCPAYRVRLGRDLLEGPETTLERLLAESTVATPPATRSSDRLRLRGGPEHSSPTAPRQGDRSRPRQK